MPVFNPCVDTKNVVAIVTDKKDPRFGQLGRVLGHEWKEYGSFELQFKDGETVQYADTPQKGEDNAPVSTFYRGKDAIYMEHYQGIGNGITGLKAAFLELNVGDIDALEKEYQALFKERLPRTV